MQSDAAASDAELAGANTRIAELEDENKGFQGVKEQYRGSLPLSWVAVARQNLDSGQAMEILSRDRNYANVRLPDNSEGWVKNAYLVDDKPAKLIVAEITGRSLIPGAKDWRV